MASRHMRVFKPSISVPVFLLLVFLGLSLWAPLGTPSAELWERWTAHDPDSTTSIDHGFWDGFLRWYVIDGEDGGNRVGYARVSPNDRTGLANYISRLSAVRVSKLNRAEQKAYWTNLYNALTVTVVLDAFPVRSIREIDISPGWFSDGPWGKKLIAIEGEEVSLDDIEHRILRPIWKDPRIHYALNCAANGCPNLMAEAVTPANIENYLERGARSYVNHPRGSRIEDGELVLSHLYFWYEEDFGGTDAALIAHLRKYATGDLAAALETVTDISVGDYDWTLNAVTLEPKTFSGS